VAKMVGAGTMSFASWTAKRPREVEAEYMRMAGFLSGFGASGGLVKGEGKGAGSWRRTKRA